MENTGLEKRFEDYKIEERFEQRMEEHGTIQNVLKVVKKELDEFEDAWGMYSSDCLGHGITCNRLMLSYIKDRYDVE